MTARTSRTSRSPHPELNALAQGALRRLSSKLREQAPGLAGETLRWMSGLAGGAAPHRYFVSGWGYPILELPWCVTERVARKRNPTFDRDLIYSTVSGYYCIRLLDDHLDSDADVASAPLLAGPLFQLELALPYLRHLADHAGFWRLFEARWSGTLDATYRDSKLSSVDFETFCETSARKTEAAKIPVAATLAYHGALGQARTWFALCDDLGRFVQMADDLLDWPVDLKRGLTPTYFLSEGQRRRRRREPLSRWVEREGLTWATRLCLDWLGKVRVRAQRSGLASLLPLLELRERKLEQRVRAMRVLLAQMNALPSSSTR